MGQRGVTQSRTHRKDTAALLIFFLLVLGAIIFVFFLMYHPLLGDGFSHLFFSSKAFLPAELSLLIVEIPEGVSKVDLLSESRDSCHRLEHLRLITDIRIYSYLTTFV